MKKLFLACLPILFSLIVSAQEIDSISNYRLLVGTYTGGKSKGIYVCDFNKQTGKIVLIDSTETVNPSYLAVSPDGKFVYAVNELGAAKGSGTVTAFSYESTHGALKKINTQSTHGDDPCYISIDKTGKWLVAGNYTGGNLSVFPVDKINGTIGAATTTIAHAGKSINQERQQKPHIHCTVFSSSNKYVMVADLGTDSISAYRFNDTSGSISLARSTGVTAGAGPRHIVFHPTIPAVYLSEEMSGNISFFIYNNNPGDLTKVQTISALPVGYTGKISAADVHISADGHFLYSSNRGDANSITIFSVERSGKLTFIGTQSCLGITPRNFSIDPSGNFLLVANQESDDVIVFKRDVKTGLLTDTGNRISIGNPVCLKWIK